jgi:hypothetical protein
MNTDFPDAAPTLAQLEQRLQENGTVVVRFNDYLEIRLPIFASVQIRITNGRLSCEPRFGFLTRERATWLTVVGIAALTATAFLDLGVTSLSMVLGFLGMSSGVSTGIRYQVTEACITRVQTAYMLISLAQASPQASLDAAPSRRELGEPAPRMTSGERRGAAARQRDR